MKEQVMVYEIKSSANSNSDSLFHKNGQYFYWNKKKFSSLHPKDIVLVVNTHSKWMLYTIIDKTDIISDFSLKTKLSSFKDQNQTYTVSGEWHNFIRLKIISRFEIPSSWDWKSLGNSETTYLNGPKIDTDNSNNIQRIESLKQISTNKAYISMLNKCQVNFETKLGQQPSSSISFKTLSMDNENATIYTAIKTKPFILLAGISGTGKSRLVRTLAYQTCADKELSQDPKKPGNFELIPVRPNWHDSTELMGYVSRINGEKYISTAFIKFIAKAWQYPAIPFFLCLDEMNLAPVEQYFAEYLSIIETRSTHHGSISTDYLISKSGFENPKLYEKLLADLGIERLKNFEHGISIPTNLVVIGTVNMDETAHSFSRKVLDRAMTFEMNEVNLRAGLDQSHNSWSYPDKFISGKQIMGEYTTGSEVEKKFSGTEEVLNYLENINKVLESTPFKIAYRVRDEFLIYCYYYSQAENKPGNWLQKALDDMTSMKILSRIEGDEAKTGAVLNNLKKEMNEHFKKSLGKLEEMQLRLQNNGYTSYWS